MFDEGVRGSVTALPRDQQINELRTRMRQIQSGTGSVTAADVAALDVIAVPGGIGDLLPGGGLARGSVVGRRGSTGILAGLLAAATGAELWAAIVAGPRQRIGLLAVTEMGGRLDRLAVIDASGGDPLEIAAVLSDGIPMIVCDTSVTVPPKRAQALTAKIRGQRGVLVITDRVSGLRPDVTLRARPVGYRGLGAGCGRVQEVRVAVEVAGRNPPIRRGEIMLASDGSEGVRWSRTRPAESAAARRWTRAG
ncbi:hypothetical protein [Nocardia blacklockiae]|uniref:hypothetical protein n=1 Tax=Nocardia blacklockiae TaxID=480036 RepID=UPI001892ED93|nr:hypothetical protein [Nocardia blacklockiae]MBF6174399.1 hypothetical protein [Nocardia blacklockiae]